MNRLFLTIVTMVLAAGLGMATSISITNQSAPPRRPAPAPATNNP
jgi:hypothetical protein